MLIAKPEGVPSVEYREPPAPTAFIVSDDLPHSARHLCNELNKLDSARTWAARSLSESIDTSGNEAIFVYLGHQEPRDVVSFTDRFLQRGKVIWIGESTDGTYCGPLLRSSTDCARLVLATATWARAQLLSEAGFSHYWPLPIARHVNQNAATVATALLRVLDSERPDDQCVLLDSGRSVELWTRLTRDEKPKVLWLDAQQWANGLLSDFSIVESMICGVFLGSCRTPCAAIADLEINGGKGLTQAQAAISTVGEAVERFAAWQANWAPFDTAGAGVTFRLRDFHPYGEPWSAYVAAGSPDLPSYAMIDAFSGEAVSVPAALIPFPSLNGAKVTTGTTAGLAAHRDKETAILNAALELIERDNFYPRFLQLAPGSLIQSDLLGDDVKELVARIESTGVTVRFLRYDDGSGIPILHAFLIDTQRLAATRGSGSGTTVAQASVKALTEAVQLWERSHASEAAVDHDWMDTDIVRRVIKYLEQQPQMTTLPDGLTRAGLLDATFSYFQARESRLLVTELPSPSEDWFAVRALAPQLTISQFGSESAGGSCLIERRLPGIIPT